MIELTGSEKQIKWAENIRGEFFKYLDLSEETEKKYLEECLEELKDDPEELEKEKAHYELNLKKIKGVKKFFKNNMSDSKFWIDNFKILTNKTRAVEYKEFLLLTFLSGAPKWGRAQDSFKKESFPKKEYEKFVKDINAEL